LISFYDGKWAFTEKSHNRPLLMKVLLSSSGDNKVMRSKNQCRENKEVYWYTYDVRAWYNKMASGKPNDRVRGTKGKRVSCRRQHKWWVCTATAESKLFNRKFLPDPRSSLWHKRGPQAERFHEIIKRSGGILERQFAHTSSPQEAAAAKTHSHLWSQRGVRKYISRERDESECTDTLARLINYYA